MTAKEKAKQIYSTHYIIAQEYCEEIQCSLIAKQCSLITVDYIVRELTKYGNHSLELQNMDSEFRYWDKVKQQIQLL